MNNEPLLGGVTDRLLALPKATFQDPSAVRSLEQDLSSIENEYHRYDGFITFVTILIEENNTSAAENVIRSCADFSELDRGEFLGKLGFQIASNRQKAAGMQKLDEASNLLIQLDGTGWSRAERLVDIVKDYMALDEPQIALAVLIKAESICQEGLEQSVELNDPQDIHDSVSVFRDIAREFVKLRELDRARQIVDSMPNDMWRNFVRSGITDL